MLSVGDMRKIYRIVARQMECFHWGTRSKFKFDIELNLKTTVSVDVDKLPG